jgi:autotransporter-associated beta strand protein
VEAKAMSRIRAFFLDQIPNTVLRHRSLKAALCTVVASIATWLGPTDQCSGQIQITEIKRFNLASALAAASGTAAGAPPNSNYIGNNVSAVAWNGSRLFVAGLNNGATGTNSQNTGIIEILNTSTTGIVASTSVQYGSRFGFLSTANTRGYSGLAMSGNSVFGAFDTGAVQPNALRGYDVSTSGSANQLWSANGRGGAGVAIDPGYIVSGSNQGGAGVGWGTFGDGVTGSSNRRALNDAVTGASVYGFSTSGTVPTGLTWNTGGTPRDITFDPATGDVYGRSSNAVFKAVRDGVNSTSSQSKIWTPFLEDARSGQNIAFMGNTSLGNLLVFNDRDGTQNLPFANAADPSLQYVKLTDTSGNSVSGTWNFLGGGTPTSTAGYYDFAYDATTQTLAVTDASQNRVSIFKFGAPDPDTQLTWAANGSTNGGSGTWNTSGTTWIGAYGPSAWQSQANALFSGTATGSTVTVAAGGVSVGRGLSFTTNGYTLAPADSTSTITLTGVASSTNNIFVSTGLTATINAPIAASAGLAKAGAGTLVVGGTVSGGRLFVNDGTLTVGPSAALQNSGGVTVLATGTFDVTQQPGGYTLPVNTSLAGAGTVAGSITVGGSTTISPGSNLGTMTVTQDLTFGSGGNYNWQMYNATGTAGNANGWDLLSVTGSLNIASTSGSPFKINLWSLSGVSPDTNGNALNFNAAASGTWQIATATGGITGFSADKFQIVTGSANGTAGFSNALSGGTFSLAQAGNSLNLVFTVGAPSVITINVASGTQTQTQAGYPLLSGTTPVEKIGIGTAVLDQANTLTGPTTVSQGTLQLATANALSSSAVTVAAGATLSVAPQVSAVVPALVNDGLVNVGLGELTVLSGLTAEGLKTQIVAGRNEGAWDGATGITSSAAAGTADRAVGWIDNGDGSFRFGFAAAGDLDMNGLVDLDDVIAFVGGGLYDTGAPAVWAQGDYDYNGIVDLDDVIAFVGGGLYDQGPYNQPEGGLSLMGFGSGAAVPEPATWLPCAGGIGCMAWEAWRRRKAARQQSGHGETKSITRSWRPRSRRGSLPRACR